MDQIVLAEHNHLVTSVQIWPPPIAQFLAMIQFHPKLYIYIYTNKGSIFGGVKLNLAIASFPGATVPFKLSPEK